VYLVKIKHPIIANRSHLAEVCENEFERFDIEEGPEPVVYVRAVGIKERNQVRIGKEVFEL
jgi:hypothetical protein